MLLVFKIVFLVPVISQMECIGGGLVGWEVESQRQVKAPILTRTAVLCLQYMTKELIIQSTRQAKAAVRSAFSPINAHGHERHPHGLMASVESRL